MLKIAIFFITFILLSILFALIKKTKFLIKFENVEGKSKVDIVVYLFRHVEIYHFKINNAFNTEPTKQTKIENYLKIYGKFIQFAKKLKNNRKFINLFQDVIMKKASFAELNIKILYGNGIPSNTAIICGFLWALFGVLISFLKNNADVKETKLCIKSIYSKKILYIDFSCIFHVRLVNIIIITLYIFKGYIKNKYFEKGGASIGSTPNRRSYENSYGKH